MLDGKMNTYRLQEAMNGNGLERLRSKRTGFIRMVARVCDFIRHRTEQRVWPNVRTRCTQREVTWRRLHPGAEIGREERTPPKHRGCKTINLPTGASTSHAERCSGSNRNDRVRKGRNLHEQRRHTDGDDISCWQISSEQRPVLIEFQRSMTLLLGKRPHSRAGVYYYKHFYRVEDVYFWLRLCSSQVTAATETRFCC